MKNFFATLKTLMMRLIVALIIFPVTPFNESTAEASEVFVYSEGNVDYYVDTDIEVWRHLPGIGYGANMKAYGSSYPPILTIRRREEEQNRAERKRREENEFNSLVAQGDKFYTDKNYSAAIQSCDKAKKMNEDSIYNFRKELIKNGDSLYAQRNFSAALDYYRKADTMYISGISRLWDAYNEVGNFDDAVSFYMAITSVYPKEKDAWVNLARSYAKIGNYGSAVVAYTNYIQLAPKTFSYWAYNERGIAYHHLGQYEQAIQDYSKAIALMSSFYGAYYNRGIAYHHLGQYKQAIQNYSKAIQLDPNDESAYYDRGLAYEQLKEYKKALKDYKKVLKLDPNNKNAQKGIERISKAK